jgi:2-keto-4-pentenoate hydratase/2-oxohepta-3-ene-1,7-dioic acid hydratase in catechol pathway
LVSFVGGFGRDLGDGTLIPMGDDLVAYLETGRVVEGKPVSLASLQLLAPVPRPGKIICIGYNYRAHAVESEVPVPEEPVLFAKFANSVVGPGTPIVVPPEAQEPDYEAELACVIGRRACRVEERVALDYVAGYTCVNDVSARDLQLRVSQWTRGKAVDTFLPLGPSLVTADEIPDPQALAIRCVLNGETMQHASTRDMIFGVAELVSFLSRTVTLEPGDVIATGTPPGVGFTRTPPVYLQDGDEVTIEIEGVGVLTNPVQRAC